MFFIIIKVSKKLEIYTFVSDVASILFMTFKSINNGIKINMKKKLKLKEQVVKNYYY